MNNNELYHYGVKGMKWGQRRAAKQISKLTGKDRSKITSDEADKFRGDVATLKSINRKSDREAYAKMHTKALGGKKYAEAVLKQANKESARRFAGKATGVAAGGAAAAGTVAAIAAVGVLAAMPIKFVYDLVND